MLEAAAPKDAAIGSDPPLAAGITSSKVPPTPEEEAIISQAIEMLCCERQAVVRPSDEHIF